MVALLLARIARRLAKAHAFTAGTLETIKEIERMEKVAEWLHCARHHLYPDHKDPARVCSVCRERLEMIAKGDVPCA